MITTMFSIMAESINPLGRNVVRSLKASLPSTTLIVARLTLHSSTDESTELEPDVEDGLGAVVVTGADGSDSQLAPASP